MRVTLPSGLAVHVEQAGSGPALVLLHGGFASLRSFHRLIEPLACSFRVLAVDLPGFGESDCPSPTTFAYDPAAYASVLGGVIDLLAEGPVYLYGHSMGAAVAASFAASRPESVAGLVLESGTPYRPPLPWIARAALLPGLGGFAFERLFGRAQLAAHFRRCYGDRQALRVDDVDYYWACIQRAGRRSAAYAVLQAFAALPRHSPAGRRLKVPTLVVWGEHDRIVPVAHGRRLVGELPQARMALVPSCGHVPHQEHPNVVLREVLSFLTGAPRKRS